MELPNRDAYERQIVRELEPIFERQYRRALKSPQSIPYVEFQSELAATMATELAEVFQAAGAVLLIGNSIVVSAGAFEQAAKSWSSAFSQELSASVVDTSRKMADDVWRTSGGDKKLLREGLALVFMADSRLENIAITETTRATSAGQQSVVFWMNRDALRTGRGTVLRRQTAGGDYTTVDAEGRPVDAQGRPVDVNGRYVNERGIVLEPIWVSQRDPRVCNHCEPLDGHGRLFWGNIAPGGPPLHPRCRCHLRWVEATQVGRAAA